MKVWNAFWQGLPELRCPSWFGRTGLTNPFYNDRVKTRNSFFITIVLKPARDEAVVTITDWRRMARPREFDEKAVLDAATERFWMNGYEATSIRDLAVGTGLTSASLYNAFGDKRALYRLVLDRYVRMALISCADVFDSDAPPVRALEQYFDAIIAEAMDDGMHKGCLVVNTALEVAPHDADFRIVVTTVFGRIEKHLRVCIAAGQSDGTILTKQPAADLGRLFLGALLGLRVLARTSPDRELLKGLVRPLFVLLQTP
jgi:TetR/AcrR family transcriptional regulator, transcriptional repressor for nem operon